MNLKKTILAGLTGLTLFAPSFVGAFTYSDGDVLLVFRADGHNNVEFNLGNIGQFLGHPDGYTNAVTNWNPGVVTSNYSLSGGNAQFAIIASTNSTTSQSWVSDGQPLVAATDATTSRWNLLYSIINSVGAGAAADTIQTEAPPGTNYLNIDPTGTSERYSFDYIASNNGQTPSAIPLLGGSGGVTAKVTGNTPTTVLFYEIDAHSAPEPPATLIGSFTLYGNGALVFQAGPLLDATRITSITAGSGSASVAFAPKTAVKYRLLYSPQVNASRGTWTVTGRPVAGTGTSTTNLTDNSATDNARFYTVQSYP